MLIVQNLGKIGNSLEVQWLGFGAYTAGAPGSIPDRELRSHMLSASAKKKKKNVGKREKSFSVFHPVFLPNFYTKLNFKCMKDPDYCFFTENYIMYIIS